MGYKCFDKNDSKYWIERIKGGDKLDELEFSQVFNELKEDQGRYVSALDVESKMVNKAKKVFDNFDYSKEDIEYCHETIDKIKEIITENE
jgi:hypothetical protein